MSNQIITGDALAVLRTLPTESVQCCVTSPPYYGLRDYGVEGQIGLEETPEAYVGKLVAVFREVRRVLRDDGTLWLNIGDSYAGSGKGGQSEEKRSENWQPTYSHTPVSTNFLDCFQRTVKGQPLIFGNTTTIRITSKRCDVPLHDNGFPYGVLLSLLGIERITIKQRDNNFCQVFNILNNESYCWISCPVISYMMTNSTDIEIVFDAVDSISVVISDLNTDIHSVLGIEGISSTRTGKNGEGTLTIKETHKPVAKCIRDIESIGDTITFDTPLKCFPDIYLVDDTVALGNRFDSPTSYSGNFRITQASMKQFCFSLEKCGVEIGTTCITHMFAPNQFGSLVHYSELYDKAQRKSNTLRPKQQLGIPDMVKRALMEDGWICRSSIIWHKPTAMPESVTDRPTTAHEHIFLLAKSERYFYDCDAIKELSSSDHPSGNGFKRNARLSYLNPDGTARGNDEQWQMTPYRNKRTVWTVASQPFAEAHFATFPPKLIEPCILAGTSPRACEHCGSPWERVTEGEPIPEHIKAEFERNRQRTKELHGRADGHVGTHRPNFTRKIETIGWQPTCSCTNEGAGKCVVLDPFCGAGTTALVALQHHRNYLGIELNPDYVSLAEKRIDTVQQNLWSGSEVVA